MDITLEKRSIVFKINHDSINLKPLLYFIENSFQNVKYFSNIAVIQAKSDELIKKRYLLKWAYKIFYNKNKPFSHLTYKELSEAIDLPIQIISTNNKSVTKTVRITIAHLGSHELSITCNQYHSQIIQYLKVVFKKSIIETDELRTLKVKINTKSDLLLLKDVLLHKKISNIPVVFVSHGLNFDRLYSEELAFENKLKKSYKVLSISYNSSTKEIKSNYKKMLRKYHPDRVSTENNDVVQLFTRRFQVIQEAYDLVKEHHRVA